MDGAGWMPDPRDFPKIAISGGAWRRAMPNRIRPRCPSCGKAMQPVFVRNRREGLSRVLDTFFCREDAILAKGRRKVSYL